MKKIAVGILGIAIAVILLLLFYARSISQKVVVQSQKTSIPGSTIVPTKAPFQELTIPFLRNKTYTSTLGDRIKYAETGTYTSYLTNYNSDGLKINGLLTIPKGEAPPQGFPAIVFIHGYIPPTQYKTTEKYIAYVDSLARNGFVVFKIDLRGHGSSEGEPSGAYFSSDYVVDTLNAYAALESATFVNKNKIGIWGHSMAGNITLRALATKPTIPAAAIWAGAVYTYIDQISLGINDQSYQPPSFQSERLRKRQELIAQYGQPSADSKFWQQVAPTSYLNDLQGAIEIHHAKNDSVVNIEYSRGLISLLDKTQVPHEFFEYESGGHNIEDPSFSVAMQRTITFFKKYLAT